MTSFVSSRSALLAVQHPAERGGDEHVGRAWTGSPRPGPGRRPGERLDVLSRRADAVQRVGVEARVVAASPCWSWTRRPRAELDEDPAAQLPTLPKPWIATRMLRTVDADVRRRLRMTNTRPRPVAASRPYEPPSAIGLPVTIAGVWP
jgi:hypothetical protein